MRSGEGAVRPTPAAEPRGEPATIVKSQTFDGLVIPGPETFARIHLATCGAGSTPRVPMDSRHLRSPQS